MTRDYQGPRGPVECCGCGKRLGSRSARAVQRTGFDGDSHRPRAPLCVECFDLLDSLRDRCVQTRRIATVTTTRPVEVVVRELVERAWVKRELRKLPMRLEPSR